MTHELMSISGLIKRGSNGAQHGARSHDDPAIKSLSYPGNVLKDEFNLRKKNLVVWNMGSKKFTFTY